MTSVWSLASFGHNGPLALGKTRAEISAAFGEPTDIAHHIWKYDSIELHFTDDHLWLMHCEFGDAPLPSGVESERLGIQPEGLSWPLGRRALEVMIGSKGFDFVAVSQPWGVEFRFGLAGVTIHQDDALANWSISWDGSTDGARTLALTRFEEAAIEWAGSGYGEPLVEAAVRALTVGLDTPTLRVLAGAPVKFADEEASECAEVVFGELGLVVPEKLSSDAFVALGTLKAKRFLASGGSPARLAGEISALHTQSDYRSELNDLATLAEWYVITDLGLVQGDISALDDEVRIEAGRLVAGLPSSGRRVGDPYMEEVPSKKPLGDRLKDWLRFKRDG